MEWIKRGVLYPCCIWPARRTGGGVVIPDRNGATTAMNPFFPSGGLATLCADRSDVREQTCGRRRRCFHWLRRVRFTGRASMRVACQFSYGLRIHSPTCASWLPGPDQMLPLTTGTSTGSTLLVHRLGNFPMRAKCSF